MSVYLSRRYQLSAAHRLFRAELNAEANTALFGKCANPHGHGHNYQVEITLGGELDPLTGMICDLPAVDACVQTWVLAAYDHQNLNLHADFAASLPSTENLSQAIYRRLAPALAELGTRLEEIRIEETPNNAFVFTEHAETLEARHAAQAIALLRARRLQEA